MVPRIVFYTEFLLKIINGLLFVSGGDFFFVVFKIEYSQYLQVHHVQPVQELSILKVIFPFKGVIFCIYLAEILIKSTHTSIIT